MFTRRITVTAWLLALLRAGYSSGTSLSASTPRGSRVQRRYQAGQAEFDKTADREILADVPWISSELNEVVDVVFGCTPAQRETTP